MKKFLIFVVSLSLLLIGCASSKPAPVSDTHCIQSPDGRQSYTCQTSRALIVAELSEKNTWVASIMVQDTAGNAATYTLLCVDGFSPVDGQCHGAMHVSTVNCLASGKVSRSSFSNWDDVVEQTSPNPIDACRRVLTIKYNQ